MQNWSTAGFSTIFFFANWIHNYGKENGPFSCDVWDIQKDIFKEKSPQNLDYEKQKWKVILNILNRVLKKRKESRE